MKVKLWQKIGHANINQETGLALLIFDKADPRAKKITRVKEGLCMMIKGSVHQEDVMILTMCAPNKRTSKYLKQKPIKLKGEIDTSTIIVGDINLYL